jgi:hypothetical protein
VKIKLIHDLCGREVLIQQVLESEGHCPWDGKAFTRDYTGVLVEALGAAEIAGTALETVLEKIAGIEPDFTIDESTLIAPLREQVDRMNRRPQGAPAR